MAGTKGAARHGRRTGPREGFELFKGHLLKINQLLILLSITIACVTLHAGDGRFGFATHFEQGWPTNPDMQDIAAAGVSYIRDDLNAGNWEIFPGIYVKPSS